MDAERKQRYSELAKARGMGGNTKHQRTYSTAEINELVNRYSTLPRLQSLFVDKVLNTEKAWRENISQFMDIQSREQLYKRIALLDNPTCPCCASIFTELDFDNMKMRLRKYCADCMRTNRFRQGPHPERGPAISAAMAEYRATPQGIAQMKRTGEINSVKMKEYVKTQKGAEQVARSRVASKERMLKKIADGYTPPVNNRWTHWTAQAVFPDGTTRKYRSSWEVCFHLSHSHLKYEQYRVPYVDEMGTVRTYIADFYDTQCNVLYELKPRSVFAQQVVKMNAVISHCLQNDIKFVWINEDNILEHIQLELCQDTNMDQLNKMLNQIKQTTKNATTTD